MLVHTSLALAASLIGSAVASTCSAPTSGAGVPQYVIDNAPLVYLDKNESYFPSDIGAQLMHTHPTLNGSAVAGAPNPLTLDNLSKLNALGGKQIYLASNDDITTNPAWLNGVKPGAGGKTEGAVSCAIITHDRGSGVVDAFYMYFYAYNQGDFVAGQELGDHVGDWEHNMIRFVNGKPTQVWFSEHSNGEAFTWAAVEKQNDRVVTYSGRGTHAQWATVGTHDHTIPDVSSPTGLLIDYTSKGLLWDPTKSTYFYSVTFPATSGDATALNANPTFTAYNGKDPVDWLYFLGEWGDDQLPASDPRQKEFVGFFKYTGGPTGPYDKQLNRVKVCPDNGIACILRIARTPGT